jgi:hypothetical protein
MRKFIRENIFKKTKKITDDLFIKRLKCTVIGEGMLDEGNIYLMDYVIKKISNRGAILEIGSYGGLSTNLMLHLIKKHQKENPFFACDPWIYEGYKDHLKDIKEHIDGREDIEREKYMQYIKESFIRASRFLHPESLPHTCQMKSDDFFEKWNQNNECEDVFNRSFYMPKEIEFCYIDGDHSYNQTEKDFINVDSKLIVGGFVLIDDSAEKLNLGSSIFIKKVLKNSKYRLVDKNPNFLFQKIS